MHITGRHEGGDRDVTKLQGPSLIYNFQTLTMLYYIFMLYMGIS